MIAPQLLRIPAPANENGGAPALDFDAPWWNALLVEPNCEQHAARLILDLAGVTVYLPVEGKQVRCGRRAFRKRWFALLPGMLFVPEGVLLDVHRRDEIFDYAHVHGFLHGAGPIARIANDDIARVRELERVFAAPPAAAAVAPGIGVGDTVRFRKDLFALFWGDGVVFEVASATRIGVEVQKLFGRPTKVYVPASEIELLQPPTSA